MARTLPSKQTLNALTAQVGWGLDIERRGIDTDEIVLLPTRFVDSDGLNARLSWTADGTTERLTAEPGEVLSWRLTTGRRGDVIDQGNHTAGEETSGPLPETPVTDTRTAVADGRQAVFFLADAMEPTVRHTLLGANQQISRELLGNALGVVDPVTIDTLTARMTYGDGDERGESTVFRMAKLSVTAPGNIPLDYWWARNLRYRASGAIRKHIGDPNRGPKVRKHLAELGDVPLEEAIASYRARYPADSLSDQAFRASLVTAHVAHRRDENAGDQIELYWREPS